MVDWLRWKPQPVWWTEVQQSRPLFWPPGAGWFTNDPPGPRPHSHDAASEIYFIAAGRAVVQVGTERREVEAGDLVFIPPDAYHMVWQTGEGPLCLYALVAPNHVHNKWRFDNFPPVAWERRMTVVKVSGPGPLPSDENIRCEAVRLGPEEVAGFGPDPGAERVFYVLRGEVKAEFHRFSGVLGPHDLVMVPAGTGLRLCNGRPEDALVLAIAAHGRQAFHLQAGRFS